MHYLVALGVAGLRNILVHRYLEVEVDMLQRILSENLPDFAEFAAHVEHYLERSPAD
jgi:uncharacterized protein YutE (UPF0331/DUF86 family)